MKAIRTITTYLITGLLCIGLFLSFSACNEQSPLTPDDNEKDVSIITLGKKTSTIENSPILYYPQTASNTFTLKGNGYTGGFVTVPGLAELLVNRNSLTPPPDIPRGNAVTITMTVDKVPEENQLIFSFSPHGCTFSEPAEIYFDWSDLGIQQPELYYIDENGNYIRQQPDDIDLQGKWMSLYVDHFSRYAFSWGE